MKNLKQFVLIAALVSGQAVIAMNNSASTNLNTDMRRREVKRIQDEFNATAQRYNQEALGLIEWDNDVQFKAKINLAGKLLKNYTAQRDSYHSFLGQLDTLVNGDSIQGLDELYVNVLDAYQGVEALLKPFMVKSSTQRTIKPSIHYVKTTDRLPVVAQRNLQEDDKQVQSLFKSFQDLMKHTQSLQAVLRKA